MNSDCANKGMFPGMPSYQGVWYAVQIEPIAHSGERLTALVIAIGEGGRYTIRNTLTCLRALQDSSIDALCDTVDRVAEAAERSIQETGVPTQESLPFSGVFLSIGTQARADNLEGIVQQGLNFSSCFGFTGSHYSGE